MSVTLFSPRLLIRPIALTDQLMLLPFLSNPENCHLLGCDPFNHAQTTSRILDFTVFNASKTGWHWVIERRDLCVPIGFLDAFPPPIHLACLQYADISYGIDPIHRSQGFMQEALATCLAHLINVEQFQRIEAMVNPSNAASYKLLESLGFKSEGIQRQKGAWGGQRHDMLAYALLAGELISPATP